MNERIHCLLSALAEREQLVVVEERRKPHERRTELRVPMWHAIRYRSRNCAESTEGELFDLSRGGAFIATERPLPVGTVIAGAFRPEAIDSNEPLGFKARVVRVVEVGECPGMGVEFLDVKTPHRVGINELMARAEGPENWIAERGQVVWLLRQPKAMAV